MGGSLGRLSFETKFRSNPSEDSVESDDAGYFSKAYWGAKSIVNSDWINGVRSELYICFLVHVVPS